MLLKIQSIKVRLVFSDIDFSLRYFGVIKSSKKIARSLSEKKLFESVAGN